MNNRENIELAIKAQKEIWRREAKKGSFRSYCLYWDVDFFSKRKALGEAIKAFQMVYDAYSTGNQIRIAISTPPRAGKSYLTSLFCSFMLGHFPEGSIMRNTCTADLHMKLTKDVSKMLTDSKWHECFENSISLKINNAKQISLDTAKQTSYFGAGVGGSIIGFGSSLLAITDDLFKKMEDALSDLTNERIVSWDESAMGSRLEGNCCRIDIGTRWTKNDVIGRNISDYDYIVSIPALNKDNKSFCEEVQSTDQYLKTKRKISPMTWSAEYMQKPIDIKGQLFKASELMFYTDEPTMWESNICVCDTADTGTDYLSCPMAKKKGNLYYLSDVIFTQMEMELTEPMLKGAFIDNKVDIARFESNNGGKLFAKNIEKDVPNTSFYWKQTTSNKETRILTDAFWIKKHIVFRSPYNKETNPTGYKDGSDYDLFMQQVTAYVKGKKDQHDDAPDSLSMLRRLINEIGYEGNELSDEDAWPSDEIGVEQIKL